MNIGIVSTYPPPRSKHPRQSGIASYTKNLTRRMAGEGHRIWVFGEKLDGVSPGYDENGVDVVRCWETGARSFLQIGRALLDRRRQLDVVHIQYTIFLYGGVMAAFTFLTFLSLLRQYRIPVVITFHEVVPLPGVNRRFLEETGIKGNRLVLKAGLSYLVRLIVLLSDGIIVHDGFFKDALVTQYKCESGKIRVIPHGIEEVDGAVSQAEARQILGIKKKRVLLFFGYIGRYKGLGSLLDAFAGLGDDYMLLVAGGEHPRLEGRKDYEEYLGMLRRKAADLAGEVRFTGFVPEEKIGLYFSAADVALFPYTRLISASGPLALCAACNKPFLASESLAGMIGEPDILFADTADGLRDKIEQFFSDGSIREKSTEYGRMLLQRQPWAAVADQTLSLYGHLKALEGQG